MNTLLIGFCALNVPLIFISCALDEKRKKQGKKKIFYSIWFGIVVLSAIFIFVWPFAHHEVAIGEATQMAVFEDAKLCYDEEQDVYFTVSLSDWNVFNIVEKKIVAKDVAQQAIENVNAEKELAKKNAKFYDDIQ